MENGMCCGSGGGGFSPSGWDGSAKAPRGAVVWRHELPEGQHFEDGESHRDFVTWVEADASRARWGAGTYYEHTVTDGD